MLIRTDNLLHRLSKNLEWATEVNLATAWAGIHDGLRILRNNKAQDKRFRIRAIVGLWGNLTNSEALRDLDDIGNLRLADDGNFHPKVYIFRKGKQSRAWIGSANFTSGGFALNEEAMLEISDTKNNEDIQQWFDERWERCGPLGPNDINEYEERRRLNPPTPLPLSPSSPPEIDHPFGLLPQDGNWDVYLFALKNCDQWWTHRYDFSVLGETHSWHNTIQELNDIVKKDWSGLGEYDRKRLLGLENGHWALLGRMRYPAYNAVFEQRETRTRIQAAINEVVNASDDQFPNVVIGAYTTIKHFPYIGPGVSTRLLALARPDRIVSLNNASKDRLAKYCDLSKSTLHTSRNYKKMLETIYSKGWFQKTLPENPHERSIWLMRAALIDSFVYEY